VDDVPGFSGKGNGGGENSLSGGKRKKRATGEDLRSKHKQGEVIERDYGPGLNQVRHLRS